METTDINIASNCNNEFTVQYPRLRFAVICTFMLLAALVLEKYLQPLNLLTAAMSWKLLSLAGVDAVLKSDQIALSGFNVRIITECTPLYALILYSSFIYSQPAVFARRCSGLLTGIVVITAVNTARIALVTLIGARYPIYFEVVHVFIGQVVMLLLVLALAMLWQKNWKLSGSHLPFLARALIIATLLFIPWLMINVHYVAMLDAVVIWIHSIFYPAYMLNTPRPFAIYNHTFAIPFFVSLIFASREVRGMTRFKSLIIGITVIALWHIIFRATHVAWTAHHVASMEKALQAVYLTGQYMIPFFFWLRISGKTLLPESFRKPALMIFILLAFQLMPLKSVYALDQTIKIYSVGRGSFTVLGENLVRVTEAELNITYDNSDQPAPQVNGAGLGAQAKMDVQTDNPGSIVIRMTSQRPFNGRAQIATIRLAGKVSSISGYLKDDQGMPNTPDFIVNNPSDEDLAKEAASPSRPRPVLAKPPAYVEPVSHASSSASAAAVATMSAVAAPGHSAVKKVVPISYKPVESLLERFCRLHATGGKAELAALLKSGNTSFVQNPPFVVSSGSATVIVAIPDLRTDLDDLPQFYIAGGHCVSVMQKDNGDWELEIMPNKGAVKTVVTSLASGVMAEYPLVVAPPLELFDAAKADKALVDYVVMVNELAGGEAVKR